MRLLPYLAAIIILFACKKNSDVTDDNPSNNSNNGGMITDTIGHNIHLWGMTTTGGDHDSGVIFKIRADGSDYTEVYSFSDTSGGSPYGTLCKSSNGKVYGMTSTGGGVGGGTIFRYDTLLHAFRKLADLGIPPLAAQNFSGMTLASDNNIYGTTGSKLFRINTTSDNVTVLADFLATTGSSGAWGGSLLQGNDGKLYGLAHTDGPNAIDEGILFSFNIANNQLFVVHSFNALNHQGYSPWGSLYQAADNSFYGFCSMDTSLLFKIDAAGNYSIVKQFYGSGGKSPWWNCGVVQGTSNKLYGMTMSGGVNPSGGILFSYDTATHIYMVEHSFGGVLSGNIHDGMSPMGTVMKASNQYLYGATTAGGFGFYSGSVATYGTLFRYAPASGEYKLIHAFKMSAGYNSAGNLIEY